MRSRYYYIHVRRHSVCNVFFRDSNTVKSQSYIRWEGCGLKWFYGCQTHDSSSEKYCCCDYHRPITSGCYELILCVPSNGLSNRETQTWVNYHGRNVLTCRTDTTASCCFFSLFSNLLNSIFSQIFCWVCERYLFLFYTHSRFNVEKTCIFFMDWFKLSKYNVNSWELKNLKISFVNTVHLAFHRFHWFWLIKLYNYEQNRK